MLEVNRKKGDGGMLIKVYGFTSLNLKILISEKIAFLWSVVLPVATALFFQKSMTSSLTLEDQKLLYMGWIWTYIVVASFVNGIGLQLARMREYGLLKTYVLIAGGKSPFVIATFVTQLVFCYLCLTIFNVVVGIYFDVFSLNLLWESFLLMLCSLPLALLTLVLTVLPLKISDLGTVINIILYPLFLLAANTDHYNSVWIFINPFGFLSHMTVFLQSGEFPILLMAVCVVYAAVGLFSYKKMNLISYIQR